MIRRKYMKKIKYYLMQKQFQESDLNKIEIDFYTAKSEYMKGYNSVRKRKS